ncbi:DUF7059 domain-containing protein [Granulicoccus phenolivorans]|uniref:DUF7059 domain-containing protein n=1 Tax=Granulicoccus phenolivorans TaxID=266854 RepID=UPI000424B403|nr:methyltransferase [Granulicoccus phenolivorans]
MTAADPVPVLAPPLRERLQAVEYTVDAVLERITPAGQAALGRNSTVAATRALAGARDPQATLITLWLLQHSVSAAEAADALPGLVEPLLATGLLHAEHGRISAAVDVRPYGSDDPGGPTDGYVVADLSPGLDSTPPLMRPDYVLGISPASTQLAQITMRRPVAAALDLGAGCGVQSLHLARHADRVVATDLNPRANALAAWTFALSGTTVDQRLGSLYEPVADEQFDLIVTNPPYVMAPPRADGQRLTYREGDHSGDGLVEAIVRGCADRLSPGGTLQVLGNWAILDPHGWVERLRSWVPVGCDALVMERERLDPYEYIEIWLADAGLLGHPDYLGHYHEWLDYFERLGIESVGMGWFTVHRSGATVPDLRVEQWAYAVQQPVGPAFADQRQAVADLRELPLWDTRWLVAEGVVQETLGEPGAADPNHVVLRDRRGFCRAAELDTAAAGVVGACDGDLTLGELSDAVAGLLDLDPGALRADLEPVLRTLIADSLLVH